MKVWRRVLAGSSASREWTRRLRLSETLQRRCWVRAASQRDKAWGARTAAKSFARIRAQARHSGSELMKPASFKYFRPGSVSEALALLSENQDDCKILAGGQSLVPAMNFRLLRPSFLFALNERRDTSRVHARAT